MLRIATVVTLALVVTGSMAFYDKSDDVAVLTPDTFDKSVMKSKSVWIIEFYAPWCGHCKRLTPEWKKAASALKGIAKVGAVDADAHASLGSTYGVQGFPTIKLFVNGKATEYEGGRTAPEIVNAVHKAIETNAKSRL